MATLPLHEPLLDESDERFVLDALRSGWVSTGGPYVDRFEKDFARFVGAEHAVSICSGTVGLQLALETLRRQKGLIGPFEVLVPSLSFIATGNAVVHAGGRPVFADTGSAASLNMSPAVVAAFVDRNYKFVESEKVWKSKSSGLPLLAVMPAHIMGWTTDVPLMAAHCAELGLPLVEDAAEALGCREPGGRPVGTRGLAAVFSFNGNKILTTGGGGMLVTNDDAFANRAKHLSTTAKSDGLRFTHDEVGYNFRLVNVLAALGCSQLEKMNERLKRKADIYLRYSAELKNTPGVEVHSEPGCTSNNWLVNARFSTNDLREQVMRQLIAGDIQVRPLWTPMHRQVAFKDFPQPERHFPNTDQLWHTTLSLPSSPQLRDDDIGRVCAVIRQSAKSGGPL